MKTVIIYVISIVLCMTNIYAQDTKEQSKTRSALCTAQAETFSLVFEKVYTIEEKVDVDKVYKESITEKTAECLSADLLLWGKTVKANAENGKFKKYRLSFEKTNDAKFKVPAKAKRNYKKAFKKAKKDFIYTRKSKTIKEIMDEKNLSKYLSRTNTSFENQKDKWLKKITK